MRVELVLPARATIGESLVWVPEDRVLFWIDVKAPALNRLDPGSLSAERWPLPSDIGGYALDAARRRALVALRTGLFWLDLASRDLREVAAPPFDPRLTRFNETACDSRGRCWIGTMFDPLDPRDQPPEPAGLFTFTSAEGLRRCPDEAELHNGMAWSPDERLFYLAHSNAGHIQAFDYDVTTGRISGRRTFAAIPGELGLPDGAAVDAAGGYWCAVHGGWRLRRYAPDGTLDREVMLPVSQPTMCAFGGPDLDTLYVSSAAEKLSAEARAREPEAGGIFRCRPAIPGAPRPYAVG